MPKPIAILYIPNEKIFGYGVKLFCTHSIMSSLCIISNTASVSGSSTVITLQLSLRGDIAMSVHVNVNCLVFAI